MVIISVHLLWEGRDHNFHIDPLGEKMKQIFIDKNVFAVGIVLKKNGGVCVEEKGIERKLTRDPLFGMEKMWSFILIMFLFVKGLLVWYFKFEQYFEL